MNATDVLPALVALVIALVTAWLLGRYSSAAPKTEVRFQAIDGLRGYLAFGVFLHHGVVWNTYRVVGGAWQSPPSTFYNSLGKGSVALFFMITAFLFFSRLLDAKTKPLDWMRLFVGRVFRLVPVYFASLAVMFSIVAVQTDFRLQVPYASLVRQVFDWTNFTFSGNPDINGLQGTRLIFAGVLWSLPYEWMFYFFLPVLGLLVGVRVPRNALVLTLMSMALLVTFRPQLWYTSAFLGGIAAAYAVRNEAIKRFAPTHLATVMLGASLFLAFTQFPSTFSAPALLLLTVAFVLIAAGNDMLGLLSSRLSRVFGEPAYSIYLLHGMILYITFRFIVGSTVATEFSDRQHWLVLWALSPVVVLVSHLSFKFIEKPSMALTTPATAWLRSLRSSRNRTEEPRG